MQTPIVVQVERLYTNTTFHARAKPVSLRVGVRAFCHNALVVPLVLIPFSVRLARLSMVVPQLGRPDELRCLFDAVARVFTKEMCGILTAHSKKTRVERVSFEIECARGLVVEDSIHTV